MGIADVIVRIRPKGPQCQVLAQDHLRIHVEVEVAVVFILFHVQHRERIAVPGCFSHIVIAALTVLCVREGGVEGGRREEQFLFEGQVVDALQRTYHTQIYRQTVVESLLGDIEFSDVALVGLFLDDSLMLHRTY